MLRVSVCVADRVWPGVPESTEWQSIGDEIDAAFTFARADFGSVLGKIGEERLGYYPSRGGC